MRVGLMGFGKTGKAVATVLLRNNNFRLEWVVRKSEKLDHRSIPEFLGEESEEPGVIHSSTTIDIKTLLDEQPVDVIIDFSSETGLLYYGAEAVKRKIKIISAVSHYPPEMHELLKEYARSTTVFWSPNITLGVNYLIVAAKVLRKIAPTIDMAILEEHFREKSDVSGTAEVIASNLDIDHAEIRSIRAGGIVGKHEIICGFPHQTIRLIHESIAREAFGNGAIFVANNLIDKGPGLYNFEELLMPHFTSSPV
jgi:4-hydroxy-tetrahydrodipicolinate reductase